MLPWWFKLNLWKRCFNSKTAKKRQKIETGTFLLQTGKFYTDECKSCEEAPFPAQPPAP